MSDSELRVTWRENLVVASCLLCAQATYAALLVLQMRHSWLTGLLGSLCLSVGASWCVSVLLHAAMQVDIGITYHLGWSMLAVAVEASCTFAALAVVDRKVPRAVEVAAGVSSLRAHVAVVKRAPWRWLLSAGLLIAAGMLGRHCLSLVALQTDASVAVDYGKAGIFFALAYLHALVFINLSFVLPAARRRTSPAALVAAAILCATIFQAQSSVLFRSDAPHLQSGARATYLRAIQTSFLGLTVCFVSVAYAGYLFKAKLSRAMTQATEAATHIANGDYSALSKEVKKLGDGNDVDPSATALRAAYVSMGAQLHRLKTFLPPAFLASLAERMEAEDEPLTTGECDPREDKPGHSGGRRSTVSSILFSHRSSRSNSSRSLGTVSSACSMVIEELGMPGTQHSSRKVAIVAFNLRDFHDLFDDFAGLAEYQQKALDLLSHCTTSNRGIVDMFQGDHACCTFNAVRTSPAHTTKAVTMLSMFNEACGSTLRKAASFGISNGTCVVGFFGTSNMKRFNVIGPAYGQAFVLESLCRQYKAVSNLLPSCVYDEVDSLMPGRCVDVVSLPGYPAPSVVMTLSFTGRASTGDSWMYDLRGPRADAAVRGIYELYAGEQEAAAKEMYEGCGTMAFDPAAVAMLDKPVAEHAGRDQGRFYVLSILKQDRPEFCYQRPVSEDPVSPALAAKRSIRSRLSTNRASSQLSLLTPSEAATNRFKPIHSASASSLFSHTSGGWQNPKLSQQAGKLLTSPKLMAPRLSQSSSQPSLVSQSTASFRWQSQTGVLLSPGSPAGGETTVRTSLTLSSRSSIQTHSSNKPSQGLDAMHLQPDYPRQPHIHEPQQQQQQQQQQQARCSLESSSEPGAQVMQSSDGSESSTPSVRSSVVALSSHSSIRTLHSSMTLTVAETQEAARPLPPSLQQETQTQLPTQPQLHSQPHQPQAAQPPQPQMQTQRRQKRRHHIPHPQHRRQKHHQHHQQQYEQQGQHQQEQHQQSTLSASPLPLLFRSPQSRALQLAPLDGAETSSAGQELPASRPLVDHRRQHHQEQHQQPGQDQQREGHRQQEQQQRQHQPSTPSASPPPLLLHSAQSHALQLATLNGAATPQELPASCPLNRRTDASLPPQNALPNCSEDEHEG